MIADSPAAAAAGEASGPEHRAGPRLVGRNGWAVRRGRFRDGNLVALALVLFGSAALQAAFVDREPSEIHSSPGGVRRVLADFAWLASYVKWETQDAAGTEAMLAVTTKLDPTPLYFWINGARMIAYDFSQWDRTFPVGAAADSSSTDTREAYCARRALKFLDRAIAQHPQSALLWIERANIQYMRLRDFDGAAESFRAAAVVPGAPYYAGRLHAEMLRRAGRKAEALAWLRDLYPKLPHGSEAAAADLVRERIQALEGEVSDEGGTVERALRPPFKRE